MALTRLKSDQIADGQITGSDLAIDIAVNTTGNIITEGRLGVGTDTPLGIIHSKSAVNSLIVLESEDNNSDIIFMDTVGSTRIRSAGALLQFWTGGDASTIATNASIALTLTDDVTVANNLVIGGNLTVNGTTTTLNTATLDVEDINITIAKGALDSATANGAGISVDGAGATLTYVHSGTKWAFNKSLDVTGTVTADGLTINNTAPYITFKDTDTTDNVTGYLDFRTSADVQKGFVGFNGAGDFELNNLNNNGINFSTTNVKRMVINSIGDISFYENTGTTAKFFWDASTESLGIGTDTPSAKLNVVGGNSIFSNTISEAGFNSTGSNRYSLIYAASTSGTMYLGVNGTSAGVEIDVGGGILANASFFGARTNNATQFLTNNTVRATIDSSGNLLVGTTSLPTGGGILTASSSAAETKVNIVNTGASGRHYWIGSTNTSSGAVGGGKLAIYDQTDNAIRLAIDSSGNVGIGTISPLHKLDVAGNVNATAYSLEAIADSKAVTARDVFVYDTSKDSDGGAWRKRTQHTSWYNEELNTATRGSRREFPAVAVIVAEVLKVTIYDGDDPDLPMWMVFEINNNYWLKHSSGTGASCVSMLNAALVTGGAGAVGRLSVVEFIADRGYVSEPGYNYKHNNISRRNIDPVGRATGSISIINISVNDVAMTVLPNAPIDAATGLPVPTIAVACGTGNSGGISVINNDGTVASLSGSYRMSRVLYDPDNNLYYANNHIAAVVGFRIYKAQSAISPTPVYYYGFSLLEASINVSSGRVPGAGDGLFGFAKSKDNLFLGYRDLANYRGLNIVNENVDIRARGMVAYVKSNYNTGYLVGDIKGAWLSDTDATNVTGTELVTNGTFDTNTSGWTGGNGATLSIDSGRLKISGGTTDYPNASQSITTVVGKTYVVEVTVQNTVASTDIIATIGGTPIGGWLSTVGSSTRSATFVATSTSTVFLAQLGSSDNKYAYIDNVACRLAEADRSVNNNGLKVFGNITKTPVATGADLVAYSGFSSSNYLKQPYNSGLDFGTGDFSVCFWVNSAMDATEYVIDRSADGNQRIAVYITSANSGTLNFFTNAEGNANTETAGIIGTPSVWAQCWCIRRGTSHEIWVNGVNKATTVATVRDVTQLDSASLSIATRFNQASPLDGSLALLRVSATAPSEEQIAKIYNDEKYLFQENAKATFYGSSDAVTALAYDEDTELLHVGTSAGRSDFQGLRRINNTTSAIGTAISAVDGFIVEE